METVAPPLGLEPRSSHVTTGALPVELRREVQGFHLVRRFPVSALVLRATGRGACLCKVPFSAGFATRLLRVIADGGDLRSGLEHTGAEKSRLSAWNWRQRFAVDGEDKR